MVLSISWNSACDNVPTKVPSSSLQVKTKPCPGVRGGVEVGGVGNGVRRGVECEVWCEVVPVIVVSLALRRPVPTAGGGG